MEGLERTRLEVGGSEIADITDNWEDQLSHVFAIPENANLVRQLIRKAKKNYPEDHTWLDKMRRVETQLEDTDDEEVVHAILLEALGQSEEDLDDDDEDEIEPEEDF